MQDVSTTLLYDILDGKVSSSVSDSRLKVTVAWTSAPLYRWKYVPENCYHHTRVFQLTQPTRVNQTFVL